MERKAYALYNIYYENGEKTSCANHTKLTDFTCVYIIYFRHFYFLIRSFQYFNEFMFIC